MVNKNTSSFAIYSIYLHFTFFKPVLPFLLLKITLFNTAHTAMGKIS